MFPLNPKYSEGTRLIAIRRTQTDASILHFRFMTKYGSSKIGVNLIVIANAINNPAITSLPFWNEYRDAKSRNTANR